MTLTTNIRRHQACQKVQTDIDAKIKWATQATEKAQAAQTQLESDINKLQSDLKNEVVRQQPALTAKYKLMHLWRLVTVALLAGSCCIDMAASLPSDSLSVATVG